MRGLHDSSSRNLSDMIGETVTIFTESGGCSGQGFSGIVIACNECFVRLVTSFGSAPENVFGVARSVCDCNCKNCKNNSGCYGGGGGSCFCRGGYDRNNQYSVGSVINIPLDKIVAFVHNAV